MQIANNLKQMKPSYIREILSAASANGVISLAGGLPASSHLPIELIQHNLSSTLLKPELYQYGETTGYAPLLEHLKYQYAFSDTHKSFITTGSQQALDLIARAFLNTGDGVVVEAPSYLGALQVFELVQANIISIAQTKNGPDLNNLETVFASGKVKLFYAVPDFHNPTGVVWTLETRQRVAELCETYNIAFIEDAPYRELRFCGEVLPLVSSLCPQQSWVLRSFSKIAFPGIRLGFATGPKDLIEPLIKVKQAADLHSSIPMQAVLLNLLQHPDFEAHLKGLCDLYHERYQTLSMELIHSLSSEFSFEPIEGGMFLWLKTPGHNPIELAQAALNNGVAIVPGNAFYQHLSNASPAIRLNFSNSNPEQLHKAVQRLAQVLC